MSNEYLPDAPDRRRLIYILEDHLIEQCFYESEMSEVLLDSEMCFLAYPLRVHRDDVESLRNIRDADLLRPGTVLMQSPYDLNRYEDAAIAPNEFAVAKHMYFSAFCGCLGAKEVRVTQVSIKTAEGETTYDVQGGVPSLVKAEFQMKEQEYEKYVKKMSLHDEFAGAEPDFEQAERFLRERHLIADSKMQALLEMRRMSKNALKSRKLAIDLSTETKSNLKILARLTAKLGEAGVSVPVKIGAEYISTVKEQLEYQLEVIVNF